MENNPIIHISMLGDFSISYRDKLLADSVNRSKKPWNLLEYMIFYRNYQLTSNELIELNWSQDSSENPAGALKTLMFRTRKLFAEHNYKEQFLIVQQGYYTWNPHLDMILDVDIFNGFYKQVLNGDLEEKKILEICRKAIAIYKGDFLPKFSFEPWVVPIQAYYHNCYLKLVYEAIDILERHEDYINISTICQQAITIEPYDEYLHYQLILALFRTGRQQLAFQHYEHTTSLLFNEFAVTPTDSLKALYKTLFESSKDIVTDFQIVTADLAETEIPLGAYYCEYHLFRELYRLGNRTIKRTGETIFLCLLTLTTLTGEMPDIKLLVKAMDSLKNAIHYSLRRGDIFSRSSVSQFIIMLPSVNYNNSEPIMKRIISRFHKEYSTKDLYLTYKFSLIEPKTDTGL